MTKINALSLFFIKLSFDYSVAQCQRSLAVKCRESGEQHEHWFDSSRLRAKETISGTRLHSHINRYWGAKECDWWGAGNSEDDIAISNLKALQSSQQLTPRL